jgi:hypothetical protein
LLQSFDNLHPENFPVFQCSGTLFADRVRILIRPVEKFDDFSENLALLLIDMNHGLHVSACIVIGLPLPTDGFTVTKGRDGEKADDERKTEHIEFHENLHIKEG